MAIMFDRKKVAGAAVGKAGGSINYMKNQGAVGDDDKILLSLGQDMIAAFKDGDAQALVKALKAFHMACEDYEEEPGE